MNFKPHQAISIALIILIIGGILTSALLVFDLLNRPARITKGFEHSEMAFYAAEAAKEKALYRIFKNRCLLAQNPSQCAVSGSLWSAGPDYETSSDSVVSRSSPWSFSLAPNQVFHFYLDVNTTYPSLLTVASVPDTDLVVFEEELSDGAKAEQIYTDLSSSIPITISSDYRYKIAIRNRALTSQNYSLSWSDSLPSGFKVSVIGRYRGYQRQVDIEIPRWQITGS